MSRPHEDRERHTLVDHRPGGEPVAFTNGSWVVIGVAHVEADRADACVAAYETLLEKARADVNAGSAIVLTSIDKRRVVALFAVRGHDGFRRLSAAWDDHHRNAQHRAVAEAVSLGLYEVAGTIGDAGLDPSSHDAFAYEQFGRALPNLLGVFRAIDDEANFRGATILQSDDGGRSVALSRFAHAASYESFRTSRAVASALGPPDRSGSTSFFVHAAKTFAAVKATTGI